MEIAHKLRTNSQSAKEQTDASVKAARARISGRAGNLLKAVY